MPRSVKREKKIEWAQLFDSGLSVAELRNREKKKPDPRTVQRAIDEVRGNRRKEQVKEAALLEGIKEHWRTLLNALDLLPGMEFDWTSFSPTPVYALDRNEVKGDGWTAVLQSKKWSATLSSESLLESKLLKEHLPYDRLWTLLASFKEALGEAVNARLAFARAVSGAVSRATGLPVAAAGPRPGLVRAGLARLDQQIAEQALLDRRPDLQLRREENGLWAGDALLVQGGNLPSEDQVTNSTKDLMGSEAWRQLLGASARLERALASMSEERDVLKLSAYLPGECRSCARYTA